MAVGVQAAIAVALTYLASKTFAETLTFPPPQSLRSGNVVLVSPGCRLSALQPPTHFLAPSLGPTPAWRRAAFPRGPAAGNSLGTLGTCTQAPRKATRPPAKGDVGMRPPESGARVLTCVPGKGSPANLERRRQKWSGGGRHDGGGAGGEHGGLASCPSVSPAGRRGGGWGGRGDGPAALRRARRWAGGSGGERRGGAPAGAGVCGSTARGCAAAAAAKPSSCSTPVLHVGVQRPPGAEGSLGYQRRRLANESRASPPRPFCPPPPPDGISSPAGLGDRAETLSSLSCSLRFPGHSPSHSPSKGETQCQQAEFRGKGEMGFLAAGGGGEGSGSPAWALHPGGRQLLRWLSQVFFCPAP